MIKFILLFIPQFAFALSLSPTPFPVFLKYGFSSVLEFEEAPTRVVLGDPQSFQIEKLEKSIVIKALASYATSNMFVYFKSKEPKLFVLSASEDSEPTYYKKFESVVPPKPKPVRSSTITTQSLRVISAKFDPKKDYLTVEVQIGASSKSLLKPQWNLVRLTHNGKALESDKLWSERKEVQKDTKIKARFIFNKPNIPRNLKGVTLVMPILGNSKPMTAAFGNGVAR